MKIQMTDSKGITLLTAGKKLDENIEVVPGFIETVTVTFEDQLGIGVTMFCTVLENGVMIGKDFPAISSNPKITVNNVIKNSVVTLVVTNPYDNQGEGWNIDGEYDSLNHDGCYQWTAYVVKSDVSITAYH